MACPTGIKPTSANLSAMMSLSKGFMMYSLAPPLSAWAICATLFSVVQNTTLGWSPPGSRRMWPMNSKPSITGMFQSSSTASGSLRRQTSSALEPSSASVTSNSRPSRIRRAILRTTLESSTTKHVFILVLRLRCFWGSRSHLHFGLELEDTIDVEDDHELAVETVDTAGELGHAGVEIDGVSFHAVLGEPQHFADLVDQEAIGFTAQVDTDRHRNLAVLGLGQAEPGAHVARGDDAAAQVQHARDLARGQRHAGDALGHEHVLDAGDRQAEQLAADHRGDVFDHGAFAGLGLLGHVRIS